MEKVRIVLTGIHAGFLDRIAEDLRDHPWFTPEVIRVEAPETPIEKTPPRTSWTAVYQRRFRPVLGKNNNARGPLVISYLPPAFACELEPLLALEGFRVVSCSGAFVQHPLIPAVIPEANPDHLRLVEEQRSWRGCLVACPHPWANGAATALKLVVREEELERMGLTWIVPADPPEVLETLPRPLTREVPVRFRDLQLERQVRRVLGWMTGRNIAEFPVEIPAHAVKVEGMAPVNILGIADIEGGTDWTPEIVEQRLRSLRLPELIQELPHGRRPLRRVAEDQPLPLTDPVRGPTILITPPSGVPGRVRFGFCFNAFARGWTATPILLAELLWRWRP